MSLLAQQFFVYLLNGAHAVHSARRNPGSAGGWSVLRVETGLWHRRRIVVDVTAGYWGNFMGCCCGSTFCAAGVRTLATKLARQRRNERHGRKLLAAKTSRATNIPAILSRRWFGKYSKKSGMFGLFCCSTRISARCSMPTANASPPKLGRAVPFGEHRPMHHHDRPFC